MNRQGRQLFQRQNHRALQIGTYFYQLKHYLPPLDVNLIRGSIIVIRISPTSNEKMVRAVKINTRPTTIALFEARTESI